MLSSRHGSGHTARPSSTDAQGSHATAGHGFAAAKRGRVDTGLQRSPDARDRARAERLRDRERRTGAPDARLLASRWGRALVAAVGLLAALTVAGLLILWPYGGVRHGPSEGDGGAHPGRAAW